MSFNIDVTVYRAKNCNELKTRPIRRYVDESRLSFILPTMNGRVVECEGRYYGIEHGTVVYILKTTKEV